MRTSLAILSLALLAGCATNRAERDEQQLALYEAHATEPVPSFRYVGRLNSWTPLGADKLAVWTSPTRAYLLEVDGHCNDLPFAQAIQLSENTGMVHARFDTVTPLGSGMRAIPCRIQEIRPIDVAAMREAKRQATASTR